MPFGGTAMENDFCRAGVLSQVARREERERRERLVADGASADAVRAEDHDEVIENVFFVTLDHVRAAAAKDASMRGRSAARRPAAPAAEPSTLSEGAARLPSATEAVEDAVEGDLNESLTILQEALSGEEEADGDAIEMARLLDGALNDSTGLNLGDVVSGAAEGEALTTEEFIDLYARDEGQPSVHNPPRRAELCEREHGEAPESPEQPGLLVFK